MRSRSSARSLRRFCVDASIMVTPLIAPMAPPTSSTGVAIGTTTTKRTLRSASITRRRCALSASPPKVWLATTKTDPMTRRPPEYSGPYSSKMLIRATFAFPRDACERWTTDYLVVGAGAMGMAFTDALIDHADVHVTLVDRRHAAGGHWLDAYPFVQLHQASLFYGVASTRPRQRCGAAERPGGGAPGAGPAVGDPRLLRRHPASPFRRLGPRHLPRRQRVPHGRLLPSRDLARVGRDRGGRCAQACRRRHLSVADGPGDDTAAVRGCRRRPRRRRQRARAVDRGAEALRDRRFRQDRH